MSKLKKAYFSQLNTILDEVFNEATRQGMDNRELAQASGLCYQTVVRLETRWTDYPRLRTVIYLAAAVGLEFTITKPLARKKKAS